MADMDDFDRDRRSFDMRLNAQGLYSKVSKDHKKNYVSIYDKKTNEHILRDKGSYLDMNEKYFDIVKQKKSIEFVYQPISYKTPEKHEKNIKMDGIGVYTGYLLGRSYIDDLKKQAGRQKIKKGISQVIVDLEGYKGRYTAKAQGYSSAIANSNLKTLNQAFLDAVNSALSKLPFTPDQYIIIQTQYRKRQYLGD